MLASSSANATIGTDNRTLYSIPEYIFPSCELTQEIQENLQLGKITCNMVTKISHLYGLSIYIRMHYIAYTEALLSYTGGYYAGI